jgi:Bacteriophage Lambda NinG protein
MNLTKLDNIFSIYIRLRDSDENGYCRCISSGKIAYYTEMDAGHFINRKHMSLRFNECNVNAQSRSDNRFDEGNIEGYRRGLIKKYGKNIIDQLYATKNETLKLGKFEINAMIKHYTQKVKELKQSKTLK